MSDQLSGSELGDSAQLDSALREPELGDNVTTGITTQPAPPAAEHGIRLGPRGWLRWCWRQLTSMRTALLLLFLLALAGIPGSILPQRGTDPTMVARYLRDNEALGPFIDSLGGFDVFATPWFGAIYILLCVSLAGCILPRSRAHWRAMRAAPPPAPARLTRLPNSHSWTTQPEDASLQRELAQEVIEESARQFRSRRWRVVESSYDGRTGWVSAEKGYLRETGNLVFHIALLAMLFGVAAASGFGWKGQLIVIEGETFSNTVTQYDSFTPARFVDPGELAPFSFSLNEFSVSYQNSGEQMGAPRSFAADVSYRSSPGAAAERKMVSVNTPLSVQGAKAFLVGHGYAPQIKVTDNTGTVVYDAPTVFLPQDGAFTSTGVVKIPDAATQLGLQGVFVPTLSPDLSMGPQSIFPAINDPALFLSAWKGDLGLDTGVPKNVYQLDTTDMERISIKALRLGQTWTLPEAQGTVTFVGITQFATFDIVHNPGNGPALIAAILVILGLMLSLFVPRRRVWVRVSEAGAGRSRIEVAGLSRTDEVGLVPTVDDVAARAARLAPPDPEVDQGTLASYEEPKTGSARSAREGVASDD